MKKTNMIVVVFIYLMVSGIMNSLFAHDGRIIFGVKLTPFRSYGWQSDQPVLSGSGSLNSYLGVHVWKGISVLGGMDFAKISATNQTTFVDEEFKTESKTSLLIPHIGVKYHIDQIKGADIRPYVYGNIFKSIASIVENSTSQDFREKLESPIGFTVAFGSECSLKKRVAIGGEVGVRYVFGNARHEEQNYVKEKSFTWRFLYTSLTLQFSLF